MYKAFIAKIDRVEEIEGANTIQKAWVLGSQVIVSKELNVGDIGIFFPEEGRLSKEYCCENNLFRDSTLNKDPEKAGFFDENGRVRTQKFMKQKSEGYFAPIASVAYTGHDLTKFKLGDSFDTLENQLVCEKYINAKTQKALQNRNKKKKLKEIFTEMFPQHVDTDQFRFYKDQIKKGALITITSKKHGTSGRYGYVKVKRRLSKIKDVVNRFFAPIFTIWETESWQYLAGTRRVDLFESDRAKEGFHGPEEYRFEILDKLKPYLTKGMVVYGEICGWVNGSPIMGKHDVTKLQDKEYVKKFGKEIVYSYNNLEGEYDFTIYRIAMIQEDGSSVDFTWPQVKEWCEVRGFRHVVELVPPFFYDGNLQDLETLVEVFTENTGQMSQDYEDPRHVLEGVVVRVDNGETKPQFYKNKSFAFKIMEGIAKEKEVDIEDAS